MQIQDFSTPHPHPTPHLHLLDANRRLEQLATLGPLQPSAAPTAVLLLPILPMLLLLRVLPPLADSPLKHAQGRRRLVQQRAARQAGQVDGCLAAPLLAIHLQRGY